MTDSNTSPTSKLPKNDFANHLGNCKRALAVDSTRMKPRSGSARSNTCPRAKPAVSNPDRRNSATGPAEHGVALTADTSTTLRQHDPAPPTARLSGERNSNARIQIHHSHGTRIGDGRPCNKRGRRRRWAIQYLRQQRDALTTVAIQQLSKAGRETNHRRSILFPRPPPPRTVLPERSSKASR